MNTESKPTLSLDAKYYTDPAIYQVEKYGVLANTWQYAGHRSAVEQPGDYFCFSIAGEDLFCVRTDDGDIKAFYNVCQHRAHQLLKDSGKHSTNCMSLSCMVLSIKW